jgi:hypothetical protein
MRNSLGQLPLGNMGTGPVVGPPAFISVPESSGAGVGVLGAGEGVLGVGDGVLGAGGDGVFGASEGLGLGVVEPLGEGLGLGTVDSPPEGSHSYTVTTYSWSGSLGENLSL